MAAALEKEEASGPTTGSCVEPTLGEMLSSLNIKSEDIGGVFVRKEEVETLKGGDEVDGVMKLLSSKPFNMASLKKTMQFT
jgi:hypothetical protein